MEPTSYRSPEISALAAGAVALQPIGAYEQHGPHLPLATDAIVAEAVAHRAAIKLPERVPAWVLPVISYGKSIEHVNWPGTITLSTQTLIALCMDVAKSVAASGIRRLVFVNAHGGNPELLFLICRDIRVAYGIDAFLINAYGVDQPELPEGVRADVDGHGGFAETSMMLAIAPERVDVAAAAPGGLAVHDALETHARIHIFTRTMLPWFTEELSVNGVLGDPRQASIEWGTRALEAVSSAVAETIVELADFVYPDPALPGPEAGQ